MTEATPTPFEADGLQNERTALAWVRTSLSLAGAGALLARAAAGSPPLAAAVLGVALVVGVSLFVSSDRARHRRALALERGEPIVAPAPVVATAIATTALALVAVGLILVPSI